MEGLKPFIVSIPQAVSTVATEKAEADFKRTFGKSFNTASGKYCCNVYMNEKHELSINSVSIPQAVSTVAT